jgi:hypothetical protein
MRLLLLNCTAISAGNMDCFIRMMWLEVNDDLSYIKINYKLQ